MTRSIVCSVSSAAESLVLEVVLINGIDYFHVETSYTVSCSRHATGDNASGLHSHSVSEIVEQC